MEYIVLVSSGERNARDDILTKLAAVLDDVGTERIRSVGLGQTRLQSCKSVRISETSDGNWRAEEEFEEDGLIIYLTIKYVSIAFIPDTQSTFLDHS